MLHPSFLTLLFVAPLFATPASQPAMPDDRRMDWWRQARFGMFIHWGIYSVPAGEWKGKTVDGPSEWIMHTAQIPIAEYEPLAARFNPKHFDAAKIVGLARTAGMKYLVITSKHHDGFCMWDAKETEWDVFGASPFHRDVMREMSDECRKQGIRFGVYYSIMDWRHPDARGENFPKYAEYLRGQVTELIENYSPDILWFDGEWIEEWTPALGDDLYALCRELKPDIIVNNRVGKGRVGMGPSKTSAGDFGTPEQEIPARGIPGYDWETCMTFNDSWGYKTADHNWKSSERIIQMLADIASKGGNFLLNIGPTSDGEVPAESIERLEEVGEWMKVNGDSIYATGPSPFGRLSWGRCTTAPGVLYLHVFSTISPDSMLVVPGLRNEVLRAAPLEAPATVLPTSRQGDDLLVATGPYARSGADLVLRLEIAGAPDVIEVPPTTIRADGEGVLQLRADDATLIGDRVQTQIQGGQTDIGFWTSPEDFARWEVDAAGRYSVELDLACQPANAGGEAIIRVGGSECRITVPDTGSWTQFRTVKAGTISVQAPGPVLVVVAPGEGFTGALMNLREVRLIPER